MSQVQVRRSGDRGLGFHGWLKSRHTFSFADYYDPKQMGFRTLRVINEDRIEGGTGFGAHPHRDMEIISYVVTGGLRHEDSMGNRTVIQPGEVQRMSAASGVVHAEYNQLQDEETHFFQIWIMPESRGGTPGYGQKSFEAELNQGGLVLVVSREGRDGSIDIKQDADLYLARPHAGQTYDFEVRLGRGIWLQVIKGRIEVDGEEVEAGDGVAVEKAADSLLRLKALDDAEFMLFDLA